MAQSPQTNSRTVDAAVNQAEDAPPDSSQKPAEASDVSKKILTLTIRPNTRYRLLADSFTGFIIGKGELLIIQHGNNHLFRRDQNNKLVKFDFKDICPAMYGDVIYVAPEDDIEVANISSEDAFVLCPDEEAFSKLFPWQPTSKDDIESRRRLERIKLPPIDKMSQERKRAAALLFNLIQKYGDRPNIVAELEEFLIQRQKGLANEPDGVTQPTLSDVWGAHLPSKAPKLWKDRDKKNEKNPADFIRSVYADWMPYLANSDLIHLDRRLYFRYADWKAEHANTDGLVEFGSSGLMDDGEKGRRAREKEKVLKAQYRARKKAERDVSPHIPEL